MSTATPEAIQRFADAFQRDQDERLQREYPTLYEAKQKGEGSGAYTVAVKAGPKYTRVDIGGSGRYMVENATGAIFGIKAYGVVHRGHQYGTLDSIESWSWGSYRAVPKADR